ncbi:hypothetical protein A2U01_0095139, partial [Trifolium medium]|nr:hypothetical protein [Trifolium medium]
KRVVNGGGGLSRKWWGWNAGFMLKMCGL